MNTSITDVLNYLLLQLLLIGRFIAQHKDFFDALQSIVTILTIPITAIWALRRFSHERPFEPALVLDINANMAMVNPDSNLLHIEVYCENIGRAALVHDSPGVCEYPSWIRVYGLSQDQGLAHKLSEPFTWEDPRFTTLLFDGWFEDAPTLAIESHEKERFAMDLLIPSSTSIVNIWIKIYEAEIKDKKLGRPYFWSTSKVFVVSKLL